MSKDIKTIEYIHENSGKSHLKDSDIMWLIEQTKKVVDIESQNTNIYEELKEYRKEDMLINDLEIKVMRLERKVERYWNTLHSISKYSECDVTRNSAMEELDSE